MIKRKNLLRAGLLFIAAVVFSQTLAAQTNAQNYRLPGSHRGAVTAIIFEEKNGKILSAGEDGFIEIWNRQKNAPEERFQIGFYPIGSMVRRPGKSEIALVETNNSGQARISVWDYEKKTNLFILPWSDSVTGVAYSAEGSFLLALGNNGVGRFQSDTGAPLRSPGELTGPVVFAATGRSERSMVSYLSSGYLSYWDLEGGTEIQSFSVPRDIKSPLLLGNNRFLAGFDGGGLLILDAVNGQVMLREPAIRNGIIFTGNPEATEFICLVPASADSPRVPSVLYHLNFKVPNRLETLNRRNVSASLPAVNAGVIISQNAVALGTKDGRVLIFNQNGISRLMDTRNQLRIEEAAVSSGVLAVRTENSRIGYIPLDFTRLNSRTSLRLEDSSAYTSITADPLGGGSFILWQSENTRSFPLIKQVTGNPERGSTSETYIDRLTLRFPLRSVSVYNNQYLFLDSVGNITIIKRNFEADPAAGDAVLPEGSGEVVFTYSSPGAQDAAFIDNQNILIGRSATPGSSAFLMVNIVTGETVPLPLSAALGTKIYRSPSGRLYGAGISSGYRTSIYSINTASPARSAAIAEIDIEDTNPAMIESNGFLAATLGRGNARLFPVNGSAGGFYPSALERSSGLPTILTGSEGTVVSVDFDGNICWHNPATGGIQAILRIYPDYWTLEQGNRITRGAIFRY